MLATRQLLLLRPKSCSRTLNRGLVVRQEIKRRLTSQPKTSTEPAAAAAAAAEEEEPKKKGWLYRMAPPKGGTEPPDAKFLVIASIVSVAGYYAWFVDPPKREEQ